MKFGLGPRLVVLATALVCVTSMLLLWMMKGTSSDIVVRHEVADLREETKLRAWELLSEIYAVRGDVDVITKKRIAFSSDEQRDFAELQTAAGAELDSLRRSLEKVICQEHFQPNYLCFYVLSVEPGSEDETIAGMEWTSWVEDRGQFQQFRESVLAGDSPVHVEIENRSDFLAEVKAAANSGKYEPIVSAIQRVSVRCETALPQQRQINIVWAGKTLRPQTDSPRKIVVIAAMDLDAPLPSGVQSPLSRMNASPRHLSVIANEPPPETKLSAKLLVYPDTTKRGLIDETLVVSRFENWFGERDRLTTEYAELKPKFELRDVITSQAEDVPLQQPLWFRQSGPIPIEQRPIAKTRLDEFVRTLDPAAGLRIAGPTQSVDNVRILAPTYEQAKKLSGDISTHLADARDDSTSVDVTWQQAVKCQNCFMHVVLFPVRSADLENERRYYGLAQAAFREEMEADVRSELNELTKLTALFLVIAGLLAFGCSLVFTRPLKQITTAARSIAEARTRLETANGSWREQVDQAVRALPVRRRDEIGVLAQAFQKMLGEVVAGHERLQTLNADLDRRVQQRTQELEAANEELRLAHDKAQELSSAKDAFLASVSHELRNPLNQVSGFCQLLEMTNLDEEQRADLQKIRGAGSQLLALINDILDYQKIIMDGIRLEAEEITVCELLDEIREAMEMPARENDSQLVVQCSHDVGTLYADKQRVRQVLLNLVGNACKFTEHGTVSLSASRLHDNGDESIVFEVADTGRGMTPQEQAKLFTPFTKLAARQGNRTGTGLGLVISKGFCEMMHGQITLQSEYGKGSTFTVCLPANTAAQGGDKAESGTEAMHARPKGATRHIATNPALAAEAAAGLAKGLRAAHGDDAAAPLTADAARTVLVIDDDAAVREVMTRYLEGRGFQVVTAVNGLEGLEKAERLLPAVITLDAVMPGLDGWGVLAALKVNRQTKDIPVIMVTITDDVQRSYSLGAAEFLTKPVDWALLSDVLARYTGNKRDGSILIVDDESEAREILRRNLERDGWKVLEAAHGAAALELLATEQPAAILLDLMMPVMDGFEFLAEYCQLAEWLSIPVIVVTAKDPTPDELARLDGVVVRVLRKGQFTQDELLKEIHRRVDQHIRA